MSDYIKREDAIRANVSQVEFCKSEGLDFSGKLHIDSVINNLKHIPAADVVERKGGQWFRTGDGFGETWMCSECCEEWVVEESVMDEFPQWAHFCPNCGADMRGES